MGTALRIRADITCLEKGIVNSTHGLCYSVRVVVVKRHLKNSLEIKGVNLRPAFPVINQLDVAFMMNWSTKREHLKNFLKIMGQPLTVAGFIRPLYNGSNSCGSNRKRQFFLVSMTAHSFSEQRF